MEDNNQIEISNISELKHIVSNMNENQILIISWEASNAEEPIGSSEHSLDRSSFTI